ncbi:WD40 repeat domain-containing protein [Nonomuraea sp. NPDC050451]|uniref:WD40 repeat domain-containing protein n=1 Tax=Nonomuraea sp. NPDC050451 TaxID=3364364 RepID=UPI0037ACCAFA
MPRRPPQPPSPAPPHAVRSSPPPPGTVRKRTKSWTSSATPRQSAPAAVPAPGSPLAGHTDQVRSATFSPGGTHLASASTDKTVRIWNVALPPDLFRAVCDIAVQPFTRQEWQRYIPEAAYRQSCPAPDRTQRAGPTARPRLNSYICHASQARAVSAQLDARPGRADSVVSLVDVAEGARRPGYGKGSMRTVGHNAVNGAGSLVRTGQPHCRAAITTAPAVPAYAARP